MKRERLLRATTVAALGAALLFGGCRCQKPPATKTPAAPRVDETRVILETLRDHEWRRVDPGGRVLAALTHKESAVRARAALAAGRMGLEKAHEPLLGLLDDNDAKVRRTAAFAARLYALDAPKGAGRAELEKKTVAAITARLAKEKDAEARATLFVGIGWLGTKADVPALQGALEGADRDAALMAWGLLGRRKQLDPTHATPLIPWLSKGSTAGRMLAAWSVYRMGGTKDAAVIDALKQAGADDDDVLVRRWAVAALGRGEVDAVGEWLAGRLTDYDNGVRVEAIRALGRGNVRTALRLTKEMRGLWRVASSNHYRLLGTEMHPVLAGLHALRPHAQVPTVHQLAKDMLYLSNAGGSTVKYTRLEAFAVDLVHCAAAALWDLGLGRVDEASNCGTAQAADLGAKRRRAQVAELITEMKREPAWKLTMLQRYLDDPIEQVRTAATDALGKIDTDGIALPLAKAIADPDPAVLGAAAGTIVKQKARLSATALGPALTKRLAAINGLKEPEAACAVVRALVALKHRPASALLTKLQANPGRAVRNCATEGLAELVGKASPPTAASRGLPVQRWTGEHPLPKRAVIVTHRGEIFLELLRDEAPATVANFARLAQRRAYQGTPFHRVVPNFVVQGGDPRGDGWGGPGHTIPCELTERPYVRGSVGMALAGRDSGGSQFFITYARQPHLDGRYPLFARVTKGLDVIDRIQPGDEIKDLYIPVEETKPKTKK